jgi:hypothetical protein
MIDEKVGAKLTDLLLMEPHRDGDLPFEENTALRERNRKTLFVNAFEEAVAEFVVDAEENADELLSQLRMF